MGPMQQLVGMLPGGLSKQLKDSQVDEDSMKSIEAIINSMTQEEKVKPQIINGSRRKRIARGSGTTVQEVNRLLKQFKTMSRLAKQMNRRGMGQFGAGFPAGF